MNQIFQLPGFLPLLFAGCIAVTAAQAEPVPARPGNAAYASFIPAQIEYDQLYATPPRGLAAFPAVLVAEVNIALHQARKSAAEHLCSGYWMPRGDKAQEIGPLISALQGTGSEARQTWIYQTFHHPEDIACGNITRSGFFQEVSRHLPAWITIRPAAHTIAYRQGLAVGTAKHSIIAAR